VSCRGDRLDAATPQQQRQAKADEAQGRLGVLGELQLVVVSGGEQAHQVDIGRCAALFAQLRDLGVLEQVLAHSGVLGALTGENEGDLGHGGPPMRS